AYDRTAAPDETIQARDLGLALGWQSERVMTGAAARIPRDATYTVVSGDQPPRTALDREGLLGLIRYWLLPRRYTASLADAGWVIAVHHPSETVGVPYRKEIPLAPYVNLFRVTR